MPFEPLFVNLVQICIDAVEFIDEPQNPEHSLNHVSLHSVGFSPADTEADCFFTFTFRCNFRTCSLYEDPWSRRDPFPLQLLPSKERAFTLSSSPINCARQFSLESRGSIKFYCGEKPNLKKFKVSKNNYEQHW